MAQQNDSLHPAPKSTTPKDTQVMAAILKESGVTDYEPRTLNQMLEFTYRYVSSVIDDALLYSAHAKKKTIDSDDVNLAISLLEDRNFTQAPNRDVTAEMARQRNNMPLPIIRSSAGLRLPADRYSLTACNYKLKSLSTKKSRTVHTVSRLSVSNLSQNSGNKGSPSITSLTKPPSIASLAAKPATPSTPVISRAVANGPKPATTPILKFTDGNRIVSSASILTPMPTTVSSSLPMIVPTTVNLPTVGMVNAEPKIKTEIMPQKRKHEDDDYDME
ncbi:hypothetical protein JTE90_013257 [Oedothorax gibbosus]|uniref:Transcription initiation factor TFIID subunit 9 n=1 Tax=Oedothorax gibbosus TaxID=931172 RepID=A0AAV6VCV2_9ARAC|nr:hypothetical protein JTE90_013257 [Oedothorax gibbosus]